MDKYADVLVYVTIFLIIAVVAVLTRRNSTGKNYDEMQLKIRGDAYKYSAMTMLLLMAAATMAYSLDSKAFEKYVEPSFAFAAVLFCGVMVFAIYAIVKGAFFSIDGKSTRYLALCAVVVLTNAIPMVTSIVDGTFMKDGVLSFENGGSNLLCVICFTAVICAIIGKTIANKKEMDE